MRVCVPKDYVSITKTAALALNSSKSKTFKQIFFPTFLCHIEPAYQEIMSLCPQLCLLAFRALFENKRAPKRGRNANFQKSLKNPRNGVIKTLCVKDQVCKSIIATCSPYRRITKDKEEKTRKRPKKGPKRPKN